MKTSYKILKGICRDPLLRTWLFWAALPLRDVGQGWAAAPAERRSSVRLLPIALRHEHPSIHDLARRANNSGTPNL